MSNELRIRLLNNVHDFYELLIRRLETSQVRISMVYYAYCKGHWSSKINEVLKKKAKEGVGVYLYVDSAGAVFEDLDFKNSLQNFLMYSELRKSGVNVYIVPDFFSRNYLHAKATIIDDRFLFMGGSNISDHYLSWTDTNFELSGDSSIGKIHNLLEYISDTESKYQEQYSIGSNTTIWYQNPKVNKVFESQLISLINSSQRYIRIVTWYFWPTTKVYQTLVDARERGVKVKIMYSQINRGFWFSPFRYYYAKKLLSSKIDVYQWLRGYNHSKLYWSETKYLIGSANLDPFSTNKMYEMFLVGHKKPLIEQLNTRFVYWLDYCRKFN